jgi:hypothetical protein
LLERISSFQISTLDDLDYLYIKPTSTCTVRPRQKTQNSS